VAILRNSATQRKIFLRTHHVFGRGRSADTVLDNLDASQLHATVCWNGRFWELRDHSRNGTLVDGTRHRNAQGMELHVGSIIGFGLGDTCTWSVDDLSAPSNLLWPVGHNAPPIALGLSNLLPQGKDAEVSIHCSAQGQWIYTAAQGSWALEDGDKVRFNNQDWCFIQMAEVASTLDAVASGHAPRPSRPTLYFNVSLDEEHVHLQVRDTHYQLDLGERSHHYALLILARLRLADAQRHLDRHAHGWVEMERLAKMLGLDPSHLNIQIFRMRKQLALALPPGAQVPELIERRRGSLRFGSLRFHITRGSQVEAYYDPMIQGIPAAFAEELLVA
jgi:hypothetical protein